MVDDIYSPLHFFCMIHIPFFLYKVAFLKLFSIRFLFDLNYIKFSCNKKDYYKKISAIQRHNTGGMTIELSC